MIYEGESNVERSRQGYECLPIEPRAEFLDIGCDSRSLVDCRFRDIGLERYAGTDPCRGMPDVFGERGPGFRSRLIRAPFQDYWQMPKQKFDLVATLFGVPSDFGDLDFLSWKVQ